MKKGDVVQIAFLNVGIDFNVDSVAVGVATLSNEFLEIELFEREKGWCYKDERVIFTPAFNAIAEANPDEEFVLNTIKDATNEDGTLKLVKGVTKNASAYRIVEFVGE